MGALWIEKNTFEQIRICFEAHENDDWTVLFD